MEIYKWFRIHIWFLCIDISITSVPPIVSNDRISNRQNPVVCSWHTHWSSMSVIFYLNWCTMDRNWMFQQTNKWWLQKNNKQKNYKFARLTKSNMERLLVNLRSSKLHIKYSYQRFCLYKDIVHCKKQGQIHKAEKFTAHRD